MAVKLSQVRVNKVKFKQVLIKIRRILKSLFSKESKIWLQIPSITPALKVVTHPKLTNLRLTFHKEIKVKWFQT